MADTATIAWTSGASLVVALISGGIALWNRSKTDNNTSEIQDLRGAVDRDLERLRAKLSHGQIVSSTQWTAEFSSYQAIWREMVAVRTLATKIVFREAELREFGLPGDYLAQSDRIQIRRDLLSKFVEAAGGLLLAIHDNAPFYPATIRKAANDSHGAAKSLIDKHLIAFTHFSRGVDVTESAQFATESESLLRSIIQGVDLVESLIRERLREVEIVNSVRI